MPMTTKRGTHLAMRPAAPVSPRTSQINPVTRLALYTVACAITAVCGLVSRVAAPRHQVITRPASVRLPEPAEEMPEPTRTAA